jgi:hypothetical protein
MAQESGTSDLSAEQVIHDGNDVNTGRPLKKCKNGISDEFTESDFGSDNVSSFGDDEEVI